MIDFIKDKDDSEAKRSNSIKSTDTSASMPENKDRMTQQSKPDYQLVPGFKLVPEIALIESLPEHLQKRFSHALTLMHEEWGERRTWEEIATESAISPYHFHRQFTELFNETPGQYLSRVRLQIAVGLLINDEPWSVIEIAQYCGFSSSQSLGKALKRELGVTAKHIREMGYNATPKETADFIQRLAHPGVQSSMEKELVKSMPTELVWYPERGMQKLKLDDPDWDTVFEMYGQKSIKLMSTTPIKQMKNKWDDIDAEIGNWQVAKDRYDKVIPEGYYLCSDVYLVSDVAYSTALEALFKAVEQQGLKLDVQGYLVEMIRHIDDDEVEGVTFSFQLPVLIP
ncbi:AraC-like DNA-binding protein [Vibrio crassostreae]|uniref:helix-turn-helix transcriptional regulator n=1 Tax=Vibrio crassostreae TaxID=246167 RepID=UPI000F4618E7|nr:AraC family transcriptional regulator [Vibrio crassostreae]ROO70220.1 AraC-like DNA-binding protein [Vibrio crassostreae]ROP08851.1 AraC-like DNA-binding protein [Vibrio crassostreae]ROQ75286.1 AraC-like DNA-binding protein [Vibrio crassostreae]ROR79660.1 AraC-like DNA-binding protein [Vibrio crassostreae]RPE91652.1 AraC-like DNA-binding protein [Vibrio crassostreae]